MSGGGKVPMPYQPAGQGQADQQAIGSLNNAYGPAADLANHVPQMLLGPVQGVLNNPFTSDALTAAENSGQRGQAAGLQGMDQAQSIYDAANTAFNTTMPQQLAGASALYGQADQERGNARSLIDTQMGQLLPEQLRQAQQLYGQSANERLGGNALMNSEFGQVLPGQLDAMSKMYGLGNLDLSMIMPLLSAAMDPQKQLYDRTLGKTQEYQNAINAQAGVAGSPYGAGLTGDATRNFQIDWENQQLDRMIKGISGLGTLNSSAAGAFGAGSTIGSQAMSTGLDVTNHAYDGATRDALAGQTMQNTATDAAMNVNNNAYAGATRDTEAAGQMGAMANQTAQSGAALSGQALSMQQSALDTYNTAGQLPYNTLNSIYGNQIGAVDAFTQGSSAALAPSVALAGANMDYLRTGQNATQIAQAGQAQQHAQSSQMWSGLGQLAGMAAAPFTGGASLFATGLFSGAGKAASVGDELGFVGMGGI